MLTWLFSITIFARCGLPYVDCIPEWQVSGWQVLSDNQNNGSEANYEKSQMARRQCQALEHLR